jgi:hypothetical protein
VIDFWVALTVCALAVTLFANASMAQNISADGCIKIVSDSERLACYDGVFAEPTRDIGECTEYDLLELQVDLPSLEGRCVTTRGNVTLAFSSPAIGRVGEFYDQNAIRLKLTEMARDSELAKFECNNECIATITGRVVLAPYHLVNQLMIEVTEFRLGR